MKLEENQQTHSSKVLDVPTAKMPHIQLPENMGIRYAVLPGDPARAERAAGYLKDAKLLAWNREYKREPLQSCNGRYSGGKRGNGTEHPASDVRQGLAYAGLLRISQRSNFAPLVSISFSFW